MFVLLPHGNLMYQNCRIPDLYIKLRVYNSLMVSYNLIQEDIKVWQIGALRLLLSKVLLKTTLFFVDSKELFPEH